MCLYQASQTETVDAAASRRHPWRPRAAAAWLSNEASIRLGPLERAVKNPSGLRPTHSQEPAGQQPATAGRQPSASRPTLRIPSRPNATSADRPPGATSSRRTRTFPHLASPPRPPPPLYIHHLASPRPLTPRPNGTSLKGSRIQHLSDCHLPTFRAPPWAGVSTQQLHFLQVLLSLHLIFLFFPPWAKPEFHH